MKLHLTPETFQIYKAHLISFQSVILVFDIITSYTNTLLLILNCWDFKKSYEGNCVRQICFNDNNQFFKMFTIITKYEVFTNFL